MKALQPDYEGAKRYALYLLENELPNDLSYHNLFHTRDEVLPAAEKFAALERINGENLLLIQTAALYHDIGFVSTYEQHEQAGAEICTRTLPGFGYDQEQIKAICRMIMATRLPQSPTNLLEEIIADADLSVLGNGNFFEKNKLLRCELAAHGNNTSCEQWYREQLNFMRNHRYFTQAARRLGSSGKQKNIECLSQKLAVCS